MSKLTKEEIQTIAKTFIKEYPEITKIQLEFFIKTYGLPLSCDDTKAELTKKIYQEIENIRKRQG